ncbi:hypothetical protein Agub_g12316 [Astrephomene gubernaculifera]|uniref:3'-5' exonuclease domain-containing protein n=1 Tax=Astrephomene gubernaculifera TaxID=47775 RepID=A0AAD3E0S7_9CHLO|nr:hypothetical protein Agub_g12316 [Astrephomene gubernaculifera]
MAVEGRTACTAHFSPAATPHFRPYRCQVRCGSTTIKCGLVDLPCNASLGIVAARPFSLSIAPCRRLTRWATIRVAPHSSNNTTHGSSNSGDSGALDVGPSCTSGSSSSSNHYHNHNADVPPHATNPQSADFDAALYLQETAAMAEGSYWQAGIPQPLQSQHLHSQPGIIGTASYDSLQQISGSNPDGGNTSSAGTDPSTSESSVSAYLDPDWLLWCNEAEAEALRNPGRGRNGSRSIFQSAELFGGNSRGSSSSNRRRRKSGKEWGAKDSNRSSQDGDWGAASGSDSIFHQRQAQQPLNEERLHSGFEEEDWADIPLELGDWAIPLTHGSEQSLPPSSTRSQQETSHSSTTAGHRKTGNSSDHGLWDVEDEPLSAYFGLLFDGTDEEKEEAGEEDGNADEGAASLGMWGPKIDSMGGWGGGYMDEEAAGAAAAGLTPAEGGSHSMGSGSKGTRDRGLGNDWRAWPGTGGGGGAGFDDYGRVSESISDHRMSSSSNSDGSSSNSGGSRGEGDSVGNAWYAGLLASTSGAAGAAGGGNPGAAKEARKPTEKEIRRAMAAASARIVRKGVQVEVPLPPLQHTADPPAANTTGDAAAARKAGAPAGVASFTAAAASENGTTTTWDAVHLLYNFGPTYKLLEKNARVKVVPLPEELLSLASHDVVHEVDDIFPGYGYGHGNSNGGREKGGASSRTSSSDERLPGCTAYTLSDGFEALLVQDVRSLVPAISWLRASLSPDLVLGIDTEWPPVFKPGTTSSLALMQLASPSRALLLHTAQMRRSATAPGGPLHRLLSDPTLTWVACGWSSGDRGGMERAFGGTLPNMQVLDVQAAAGAAGWPRLGLASLVRDVLGVEEFSKSRNTCMTNWAKGEMSEAKVRYAVLDALLPPLLLRQLRLFAALPGLRCCFCKQPFHAPAGMQQLPPPPLVKPPTGLPQPSDNPSASQQQQQQPPQEQQQQQQQDPQKPALSCDHCGRTFWSAQAAGRRRRGAAARHASAAHTSVLPAAGTMTDEGISAEGVACTPGRTYLFNGLLLPRQQRKWLFPPPGASQLSGGDEGEGGAGAAGKSRAARARSSSSRSSSETSPATTTGVQQGPADVTAGLPHEGKQKGSNKSSKGNSKGATKASSKGNSSGVGKQSTRKNTSKAVARASSGPGGSTRQKGLWEVFGRF